MHEYIKPHTRLPSNENESLDAKWHRSNYDKPQKRDKPSNKQENKKRIKGRRGIQYTFEGEDKIPRFQVVSMEFLLAAEEM